MSAELPLDHAYAPQPAVPELTSLTFALAPTQLAALGDFFAHEAKIWTRQGHGLVGFGEAASIRTRGEQRFTQAREWFAHIRAVATILDPIQRPGSALVCFGAFSFSFTSSYESRLVIPQVVIGQDSAGAWITVNAPAEDTSDLDVRAALDLARRLKDEASMPSARGSIRLSSGQLTAGSYVQAVGQALSMFDEYGISKLVLARDILAQSTERIDLAHVVAKLTEGYGKCWTYLVDGLVGATPEMLVRVTNGVAEARVLAGTLDRATAPSHDPQYPSRMLLDDPKQRTEHELAIDSLTEALAPISHGMNAPREPFILELPNVWHLASDVSAQLKPNADGKMPTALDLVEIFHPTAAVCGTPTKAAGVLLRKLEGMDRGPYAGPVGWLDGRGDGEFGIALRGGVLEAEKEMRLYAGCGIVPGSVPEAELAESWAKMRPMRQALEAD